MTSGPAHDLPLGEALRRHAEGDRSPEVLSVLNHAAWDAFHAPWEAPFPEPPMPEEPEAPAQPTANPGEVQPFSQAMLAAWTDQSGFKAFQHPSRGLVVDFRYSLKSNRCVQLRTWVSGRQNNILMVVITCDRRVPPEDFTRALRLCNAWNLEYRWPRAKVEQEYLTADASDDPQPSPEEVESREETHHGQLCLDTQICLSEGIHQAALNVILDDTLSTSWDFWRMAHAKWGL